MTRRRSPTATALAPVLAGCVALSLPARAQPETVEIVDWIAITGVSMDEEEAFFIEPTPQLPYQKNRSIFVAMTPTVPTGSVSTFYNFAAQPSSAVFNATFDGSTGQSPDFSGDGPFVTIAVLVRLSRPTFYGLRAEAGVIFGGSFDAPFTNGVVTSGFCFAPGWRPGAGEDVCTTTPENKVVFILRTDPLGEYSDLESCCEAAPGFEAGSTSGTLPAGDYTLAVQALAALNSEADGFGAVTLTIGSCAADLNGDGIVDNGDINDFIDLFLLQDLGADFNGDGIVDFGDISVFLDGFLAGC